MPTTTGWNHKATHHLLFWGWPENPQLPGPLKVFLPTYLGPWLHVEHRPSTTPPQRTLFWHKVAADLSELRSHPYLLVIDYFSHYVEVAKLSHNTSLMWQHTFSQCLQDVVALNNSSLTMGRNFHQPHFPKDWISSHPYSPLYPQAKDEVQRAVQTVKNLLKKTSKHWWHTVHSPIPAAQRCFQSTEKCPSSFRSTKKA